MIRCLVTGGNGFIGRYAVTALRESGREVVVLTRTADCGCELVRDLTAQTDLGAVGYDEVYHIAGLAHRLPRPHLDAADYFMMNVKGTRHLIDGLEKTDRLPKSLVFISSVSVYGRERGKLLDEDTPREATDPYGASKRDAEDLLMSWGEKNSVRIGIVRLPLVAGPNAPGNLGSMINALKQGKYLGVGDGLARRSIVRVDQVAKVLSKVSEIGGVYHLTDGQHPSFVDLEEAFCSEIGRSRPMRLPLWLAKTSATCGDFLSRILGRNLPINSRVVEKMTETLTFSDDRAQASLGWRHVSVLDHAYFLVKN